MAPRTIVKYSWNFGNGGTASGMVAKENFETAGVYTVSLTVTDDAGNTASTTQTVTVGTSSPGGLAANFTFSPTAPLPNDLVNFNASTSTSADPIVNYQWDFGDGATASTASKTTTHAYAVARIYVVTLTIRDSKGRSATTSKNVTLSEP